MTLKAPSLNFSSAIPVVPAGGFSVVDVPAFPSGSSSYLARTAGSLGKISCIEVFSPSVERLHHIPSSSVRSHHPKYPPVELSPLSGVDSLGEIRVSKFREIISGISRFVTRSAFTAQVPKVCPLGVKELSYLLGSYDRFGISWDGRGNHTYDPSKLDEIRGFLGQGRYAMLDWDVIKIKLDGDPDPVFIFPKNEPRSFSRNDGMRFDFDFSKLFQPSSVPNFPIIFYMEGMDPTFRAGARNSKPGSASWVVSLRELGYDIRFVNQDRDLAKTITDSGARMLLISSTEEHMSYAVRAYHVAKNLNPDIVVALGGAGAIPEAAGLFDLVGVGEHYIGLPALLRKIQELFHSGDMAKGKKTPWGDFIGAAESDPESKEGAMAVFGEGFSYSPLFSADAAAKIFSTSASRYFTNSEGVHFQILFPVFNDPLAGASLFVKSDSGILAPVVRDSAGSYGRAKDEWEIENSLGFFPLREKDFIRASRPIIYNELEFDVLSGARYPSNRDGDTGVLFGIPSMYAQHGCRRDPESSRCSFCSIKYPAGNRAPSIDQIIKVMQRASLSGKKSFLFNDDRFVQDKAWVLNLVDAVVFAGLDKKMQIGIQTRADGISAEVMSALRNDMGAVFGMGVETLSPARAQNPYGLGKIRQGGGDAYVNHARETIEMLAANPRKGDSFYMICASPGDSITDIAEDVYNQLHLMISMWNSYGYFTPFKYNFKQIPFYQDRLTPAASGYLRAQPGAISLWGSRRMTVGGIEGEFIPFGPEVISGSFAITGLLMPKDFAWQGPISDYVRHISGSENFLTLAGGGASSGISIGDLIDGLESARGGMLHSLEASQLLDLRLAEIREIYSRIPHQLVPMTETRHQRAARVREKGSLYGSLSGNGIS